MQKKSLSIKSTPRENSLSVTDLWHMSNNKLFSSFIDYSILNIRTDDIFLVRFLSCCEWNSNDAFQRIKKLFKLKVSVLKWF